MSLNGPSPEVLTVSHRYGTDSAFVLAGGGNTSSKTPDTLWVKASGHALATIGPDGFVALDRAKLEAMLRDDWPADVRQREAEFLSRVNAARRQPERGQRPSVEALLHHLLPGALVVHTHPGLVNAVTCCVDGERLTQQWFGDEVLWQPYVDPGLILAQALSQSIARHVERSGRRPTAIFLQNHGLIVDGQNAAEIEASSARVVQRVESALGQAPAEPIPGGDAGKRSAALTAIQDLRPGTFCVVDSSPAALWLATAEVGRAAAFAGPLTPDQIVYCRSLPLWLDDPTDAATAWAAYEAVHGVEPWVVIVADAGVIAVRSAANLAATTQAVYHDAADVYRNSTRLGGVRPLSPEHRRFIESWEVEAYRRSVAAKA